MRKLVKDTDGNVMELVSLNGFIPEGFELVPEQEIEAEELALAKRNKLDQIRAERDRKLSENDRQWMIASKKGEDTKALEDEAQLLRDLPKEAEKKLNRLRSIDSVKSYDAFGE